MTQTSYCSMDYRKFTNALKRLVFQCAPSQGAMGSKISFAYKCFTKESLKIGQDLSVTWHHFYDPPNLLIIENNLR